MNANEILAKISSLCKAQGYHYERPSRDLIGTNMGFVISRDSFKCYGTILNTNMGGQIWQEIKPNFYKICESRKESSQVILND
ncbi:MAG: hypothetical protein ACREBU_16830 [Nitrososphaera sp.]